MIKFRTHPHTLDMTKDNPLKVILLFVIPLLLGNLFQQLYNIVDSMVVGNFVGDNALAAVASSGSLINLLIGLIQGISVGAGIVIAQHYGAGDKVRMKKAVQTTISFSFVLGIIMTFVGFFLSPYLLKLMNTPSNVLPLSNQYFQVYFLGVIFTILYNSGSAIFRAVGDSKTPLYYLIVATVVNIVLDLLFVGVFKLNVIGAALATIISQFISMLLTFIKLMREKSDIQVTFKEMFFFDKAELKRIIAYGLPNGISNSIISLSNVFIQSNINSFGDIAQAGCGAYQKIEGFATMPSGSFSMALSTYVGQNVGAKDYKRVKKGAVQGLIADIIITELIGVILFIFGPFFISLFSKTPSVIEIGTTQARIIVLFYFLLAYSHGVSGILRGLGYNKIPMFTMIIFWVIVRIVGIPIMLNIDGFNKIDTIFWFYPFTWFLSTIVLSIVAIYSNHKINKLITLQ